MLKRLITSINWSRDRWLNQRQYQDCLHRSPGSLTFEVQDIRAIADVAHENNCVVIMDDTWSSVSFQTLRTWRTSQLWLPQIYHGSFRCHDGCITTTNEHWQRVRQSASSLGAGSGPDDVFWPREAKDYWFANAATQ